MSSRRLRALALVALLPLMAAVFWLTAVATSGLPGTAIFAINVHSLTLNDPTSSLRPAPLSLSVLDDAQLDAQAATARPSATPAPSAPVTGAPVRRPTPTPTPTPTRTATPTPTATPTSLPLPSPSVPVATPSPSPALATIAGQVVDSLTKSPIAGAAVSMTPPAATGLTDSNGNFALMAAAGSYTVTVTAAGYNSASQQVTVRSGQRQTLSFKLTSNPGFGSITGYVSDWTTGGPIAGAMVTLSNGPATVTDATGYFSLPVVLAGTYTITFSALNYVPASFAVTVKTGHSMNYKISLQHA